MVVETTSSKASNASVGEKPAATSRRSAPSTRGTSTSPCAVIGVVLTSPGSCERTGAERVREREQPLVPRGELRHRDSLEHRRADQPEELVATGDVVVERGHRDTESLRDRRHGDLLGAGLGRELHRGADDAVSVDASRTSGSAAAGGPSGAESVPAPLLSTVMVP